MPVRFSLGVSTDWFTRCVKSKHYIKNKITDSPATKHTLCIRISMILKMIWFLFIKKKKRKKGNETTGKKRKGVIQRDLANKQQGCQSCS